MGQVVGIVGEPGMGKSRLVYEFCQALPQKEVQSFTGHCHAHGRAIPYLPVLELLHQACGLTEADGPAAIGTKIHHSLAAVGLDPHERAPYLLQLLGVPVDAEPLVARSPEAVKAHTLATLCHLLLQSGHPQPLVLVVEDVHWIDRLSAEVCTMLADHLAGLPLVLLTTYRPGSQPPWMARSYATQLPLAPLSSEESRTIVQARYRHEQTPDTVLQAIVAKADGNPLCLEELTQVMLGDLTSQRGVPVPDTIHSVIMARLDRLPTAARRLLQTATVLGRRCTARLLAAAWEGLEELEPLLHTLQQWEFLYTQREAAELCYVFKHALTQEVAYNSLRSARRQLLHLAAGRALEGLYAGREAEVVDHLAYHYAHTQEASKAVAYLLRFAARATRAYAHAEAAQALTEALRHVERLPAEA